MAPLEAGLKEGGCGGGGEVGGEEGVEISLPPPAKADTDPAAAAVDDDDDGGGGSFTEVEEDADEESSVVTSSEEQLRAKDDDNDEDDCGGGGYGILNSVVDRDERTSADAAERCDEGGAVQISNGANPRQQQHNRYRQRQQRREREQQSEASKFYLANVSATYSDLRSSGAPAGTPRDFPSRSRMKYAEWLATPTMRDEGSMHGPDAHGGTVKCLVPEKAGGERGGKGGRVVEFKIVMRANGDECRAYALKREAYRGGFASVLVCSVLRGRKRSRTATAAARNDGKTRRSTSSSESSINGEGTAPSDTNESKVSPNSAEDLDSVRWEMTDERAVVKIVPRTDVSDDPDRPGEIPLPDPLDEVEAALHASRFAPPPDAADNNNVSDEACAEEGERCAEEGEGCEKKKEGEKKSNKFRVVRLLDVLIDYDYLYLILPYYPKGELFAYIEHRGSLSEGEARTYFLQILEGICQLQRAGIAHLDLSVENVLLDEQGECVIIDLGSSIRVPLWPLGDDKKKNYVRSLLRPMPLVSKAEYLPPEALHCTSTLVPIDPFAVDRWALGVMLMVMLTGRVPWKTPEHKDYRYGIVQKRGVRALLSAWEVDGVSDECIGLLGGMLAEDVGERLTMKEILEHPWVTMKEEA